ncbi:phosphatidate phosphatase APP1 [Loktanella ponticola]|uniref:Phosphatidate phosphatase APP1 n=1 Tax=Yoonia ponticola TaxID=1524255 RepID=A0A7W9BIG1_9RHOB|nr:phosphatase domain-containing protein [Yoonia ponticola]MBB5721152.1 phosphatidate phosphatase APP1 [Yoonia ponticola]
MTIKLRLARIATAIERRVDPIVQRKRVASVLEPYIGYATPEHLVVRGRVLGRVRKGTVRAEQNRWTNLRQMLSLFLTNEVSDITVHCDEYSAISDDEGYFTILVPRDERVGWVEMIIHTGQVTAICPVFVPFAGASLGVISDIDDTMMETGAYSLWRNLWTSLTGNALTRNVFPDAVVLMEKLFENGRNPIFFVSSSPWNLHGFLDQIFERTGLPRAPKFLRDYGISETQFITGTHGDHKGRAIDVILTANPALPFILIGDTGQHDAQVYSDAIQRHPERIRHVILRAPGRGADAEDMRYVDAIRHLGVPVTVDADYTTAIAALR